MTPIKKIAFASLFALSFNVQANKPATKNRSIKSESSTTFSEKDQWKYLEFQLLVQPSNKINSRNNHVNSATTVAFAGLAGYTLWKKEEVKYQDFLKPAVITAILAAGYYKLLACFINHSIYESNFVEFVRNWSSLHKEYTPEQFHELFDALADILATEGEKAVATHTTKVMELILFHMSHEFKDRYKGDGLKPFEALKTLTDLLKNGQSLLG